MKVRFQPTAPNIAYMFGVVLVIGSVASASLTEDTRWMEWHFSRLGEGGHLSSTVFNISLIIAAIMVYFLGRIVSRKISQIGDIRAHTFTRAIFYIISLCMLGVALFPFDKFPVLHNTLGYSMLSSTLIFCVMSPSLLPIFPKKFYRYCYLIMFCAVISFVLFFVFNIFTLLEVESIMFAMLYIWLLLFVFGVIGASDNRGDNA